MLPCTDISLRDAAIDVHDGARLPGDRDLHV